MRWLAAGTLALVWVLGAPGTAAPAEAAWHEASSENFVIYADDSPRDIERFAQMLERYHAAMQLLTSTDLPSPSPSARVTIYAVGGERDMRELSGSDRIGGFYIPRAGRSRAFVQDIRVTNGEPDYSMIILMHEYAHHFLISSSRFAMPHWLSEGAAEFFASARFPRDGSIQLGRPAYHRQGELVYGANIPVETLIALSPQDEDPDAFYGRSWLLYHFLVFDEERNGQFADYWRAVATGTPSLEAGRQAFGDLAALDRDLGDYLRQRRVLSYNLPPEMVPIGPISVRPVSPGFGEMLPVAIVSQRGVDEEEARALLPRARAVAARHPDDPHVLAALAEAEFDAGNDAEAIAAADRALAIDPTVENALVQKGNALFRIAETATDPEAAYRAAMVPFSALNRLENDHPLPLIHFYRSFVDRGLEPNETARHALERAAELAPFDKSLWMNAALMQAGEGRIAVARFSLAPLAADPHGGRFAEEAAQLMAALAGLPDGEPVDVGAILAQARLAADIAAAAATPGLAPEAAD